MAYGDSAKAAASRLAEETRRTAYAERHPSLSRDGEAGFFDAYVPEACPWRGSLRSRRDGHGRNGVQRCRCLDCRRTFAPATGTIFDSGHLPVSEWAMFLPKIPGSESEAACARDRQRSSETPPCWTAELFGVLAGRQDGTVPADGIWPGETCWPVDPKDRRRNAGGSAMGGLSRNKACIGIAEDIHGASLCLDEGPGKTSGKRTRDAFGSHMERGSGPVHDRGKPHRVLAGRLDLESGACDAKGCCMHPDRDSPLNMASQECSLLKKLLRSRSGSGAADIQGWLGLWWASRNVGGTMDEKAAWVLDRAMRCRKVPRCRDFYAKRTSQQVMRAAQLCKLGLFWKMRDL